MLHERLNRVDNISMLLIRRKVQNHICLWDEIFVGTYRESVLSRAKVRSALLSNRCFAKRVGDIQAAVAEVQTLVQPLCTATDDDDLFVLDGLDAVGKLFWLHETALAKFFQLHA